MRNATRMSKSFTIEPDLDEYVKATRGSRSASERVNELLRRAMVQEKYDRLAEEAEAFYSAGESRTEAEAFQAAQLISLQRED